jgi:CheY-like chemotaxis protein
VEDNDELREFLVAELGLSYHVLQAGDGERGWALAQSELPDIVLTDVMMPRMDGRALTLLIKGHADTNHIAVVMLTARSAQPSRIEGLQQGADDYLSKPFSVEELQLRLHNLISRQARLGEHYRQQFELPRVDSPSRHDVVRPVHAWHSGAVDSPDVDSPGRYAGAVESPSFNNLHAPKLIQDPFLGKIYALLERHLDDTQVNVDWLADQLAMNRKTLYRKVHSLIQLAPAELIRQYRLRRAADLMGVGHNMAETADRVGFSTPSHFAIVFKEFYGQTPTEFIASRAKPV